MQISKLELEEIVKTLPIGLYLKRRIPLFLDDEAPASYYSPMEDKIGISYKQICQGLEPVTDEAYLESAIRASVYHEVSHAMLTPNTLKVTDIINIFEDERIETVLSKYYLDVNFKKNIFYMNGISSSADITFPTEAMEAFYQLVRFRYASGWGEDLLPRVIEIIDTYKHLSHMSEKDYRYDWQVYDYREEINKLYEEVEKRFSKSSKPTKSSFNFDIDFDSAMKDLMGEGNPSNTPFDTTGRFTGVDVDKETAEGIFNHSIDVLADTKLAQTLEIILSNFNKKNSGGSAINSYSGRFNPRAVTREDYRYFEKPMTTNGNNTFGTCHLTLFIDKSGSFWSSETTVNKLLKALTDVEKRNKNFSLDVVFCGVGQEVCKTIADRQIVCEGGNRITADIFDTFRKMQKKNTYNYNIVLFDGDAFSDCSKGSKDIHNFRAFDTNNTTIISDRDNHKYLDIDVSRAKIIYTRDYTKELIKNVTKVLEQSFK